MKTRILLAFLLPLLAFTHFTDVVVSLDDRVSVKFPSQPRETTSGENPLWMTQGSDGTRYMAMIVDYAQFGMDSASVTKEIADEKTFEVFKESFMGELSGSKLLSEARTKTNGYITFEFKVELAPSTFSDLLMMYSRNIFVGNKMYSLTFYEAVDSPRDEARKKFFDSFQVK